MATSNDKPGRYRLALGLLIAGALLVRVLAIVEAPRSAYLMDHVMFMAWSDYAYEHGPANVYEMPPLQPIWVARGGERVEAIAVPLQCNYPPLATLIFWAQGLLWHGLDDQVARGQVSRRHPTGRIETVPVESRVVNTVTSRFVNALAGIAADLLLAWGVLLLVRTLGPTPMPNLELAAFALAVFAPAVVIDAAFWSQSDSWVTALMVWVLLQALRRRFWLAGALFGTALMLKAQAIILAPALAFACVAPGALGDKTRVELKRAWPALRAVAIGTLLVIGTVAVPFSLGATGVPGWVERAYLQPVLQQYPYTTTKAFNLWWLEGAVADQPGTLRDSRARVLGITKDTIGRGLLVAGVLLSLTAAARRFGPGPTATVAAAALIALAAFVLPTRVKARYIYYGLPFLIAAALRFPPWRVALAGILLVSSAELTWNLWYDMGSSTAQGASVLLATMSVASFAWMLASLFIQPKDDHST